MTTSSRFSCDKAKKINLVFQLLEQYTCHSDLLYVVLCYSTIVDCAAEYSVTTVAVTGS